MLDEIREPRDVRWMRRCLNNWPFPRGKGLLMRVFQPWIRDREFFTELEPGILVRAELDDYLIYWAFVERFAKVPCVELSRSLIRPSDTVLDVGANVGLWVMGTARIAGPQANIHAFEPVPENFIRLTSNLALNGIDWVRCQPLALSDKGGRVSFYKASEGNSGMGSLARHKGAELPIEVTSIRLDDYCKEHSIERVDFMKVDVEGAEQQVFSGAPRLLTSPEAPIIMFEAGESLAAAFASTTASVKTLLHQYGYSIFHYDGRKLQPVKLDQSHVQDDLFALKPAHFKRHSILNTLKR